MRQYLLLIIFTSVQHVYAQLPNNLFHDKATHSAIQPKRLEAYDSLVPIFNQGYLSVQALSFLRNNEYFSTIYPGQTYFGYQFQPEFVWFPNQRNLPVLRLGLFMQYHYGDPRFQSVRPVFSIIYKKQLNEFIFGTLKGAWEHNLIEPLYGFERGFEHRIEEGFQYKYKGDKAKVDFWVNWMQTTILGSQQSEKIMAGLVGKYQIFEKKSWYSHIEFQGLTYHEGGAEVKTPIVNRTNAALGGEIGLVKSNTKRVFIQSYLLYSLDHSLIVQQPYTQGRAIYSHLGIQRQAWLGMLGYWQGIQYFSTLGSPVFQSFAGHNNYIFTRENRLLFMRLLYTMPIKHPQFESGIRLEPIYNIDNQSLDYSFGFFVKLQLGL